MFTRAQEKVEEARVHLAGLRSAADTQAFRSHFNAFMNAGRAITNALQAEGGHVDGFRTWYKAKQQEMRSDELLRFVHDARIEDFHKGRHQLQFPSAHIEHFSTDQAEPPPSPNASLAVGTQGPFWIVDEGTPRERRIPVKKGGSWTVQVEVANAPRTHQGKPLERNDPVTLCQLALEYYENLVYEANARFAPPR